MLGTTTTAKTTATTTTKMTRTTHDKTTKANKDENKTFSFVEINKHVFYWCVFFLVDEKNI